VFVIESELKKCNAKPELCNYHTSHKDTCACLHSPHPISYQLNISSVKNILNAVLQGLQQRMFLSANQVVSRRSGPSVRVGGAAVEAQQVLVQRRGAGQQAGGALCVLGHVQVQVRG
jgi:hypothetical protein